MLPLMPRLAAPARAAGPGIAREAGPSAPGRGRAVVPLGRHWLIAALLAAGLLLRAAAQVAYRPALLYVDTIKYLYNAWPGADPLGYKVLLGLILPFGGLATVAAIQHLLGLAMAVTLYALMLRRGVSRWLAALAAGPVLLDAYQLQMEQTIMPDVWFEAMIVAGIAALLWRPAATTQAALAAGLILGSSATVRQVGEILVLPAVVYLLAAGRGSWQALGRSAALAVAFVLPILCYCGVSYARTGHFWLSAEGSVAGRLAAAADCATLKLPAALRPLCPAPGQQAKGPDWLGHARHSPLRDAVVPPGVRRDKLISEFDTAVERQQPLRVLAATLRDAVRLFALTRTGSPGVTPISRWQFQAGYPAYRPEINIGRGHVIVLGLPGPFRYRPLNPAYGGKAQVDRPLAAFLRSYQLGGGYTPGPLLAAAALAGLAGSLLALARRTSGPLGRQLALACLLFCTTAAAVMLISDVFEFSWRYQLPALVTLPPAGALGIGAIQRWHPGTPRAGILGTRIAALSIRRRRVRRQGDGTTSESLRTTRETPMKQYLLSVHYVDGQAAPSQEVMEQMYRDVEAVNGQLREAGAWVFAGGLEPASIATVVRMRDGQVLTTDGPFAETKEQLGGFWVIQAADLDAALAWSAKAAEACRGPVEVRPFQDGPAGQEDSGS